MTIFWHEMKRGKSSLLIWTTVICFMLGVCVLIYPEMAAEMDIVSDMFANMGSFSSAFGMDSLNFGEFMGYFAVECGNQLGLGGAMFAAIMGDENALLPIETDAEWDMIQELLDQLAEQLEDSEN